MTETAQPDTLKMDITLDRVLTGMRDFVTLVERFQMETSDRELSASLAFELIELRKAVPNVDQLFRHVMGLCEMAKES